jgi:uncharacterized membrane protein
MADGVVGGSASLCCFSSTKILSSLFPSSGSVGTVVSLARPTLMMSTCQHSIFSQPTLLVAQLQYGTWI